MSTWGELLPNYGFEKEAQMQMKKDNKNRAYWVKESKKEDMSFGQWCEAFEIYLAVYIEKAGKKERKGGSKTDTADVNLQEGNHTIIHHEVQLEGI